MYILKKFYWIHGHLTMAKLPPKLEHVSTAEMAPRPNHTKSNIKPNWIHVHVTKIGAKI
jgi:hypothetical protein